MRADAALADRRHAVRVAAKGWHRAGAIDEPTLNAVVALYPDDRIRLGLGLRILAGAAALFGGGALAGLANSLFGYSDSAAVLSIVLAVAFAVATEYQTGNLRRAQAGAEYATAFLAAVFAGLVWPISSAGSPSDAIVVTYLFAFAFAVAAWRWGHPSLAALAAILALCAAAQAPYGRAAWLIAGIVAMPLILGPARSPRWPPAHRDSFMAVGIAFLAGAYVAVNLYSLDHRWIEWFDWGGGGGPGAWSRGASIAGTILMPPVVLLLGTRRREPALLAAGALFAAASLVTLRQYHPIGPWWLSLILGGTACLALAVSLRRWLHAGPAHERSGFTAEPLFDDRRLLETAQAAAVIAAMSPAARLAKEAGFEGGGGRSGGGGASGTA